MTAWCHLPTIFKQRRALLIAGLGILFVAFITTLLFANVSHAATSTNRTINFQGRLLTSSGAVVPDGHYNIQFKIYQGGSGAAAGNPDGTLDWTESHINNGGTDGVEVRGGFFSVSLGSTTPFGSSVDWSQSNLWLSMNVAGSSTDCTAFGSGSCVGDGEMLPMKQITATPYAINASQLGGLDASSYIQNTTSPQNATLNITGSTTTQSLKTASVDTASAGTLTIGGTNATSITLADNTTVSNGASLQIGTNGTAQGQLYVGGAVNTTGIGSATLTSTNTIGVTSGNYTYVVDRTNRKLTIYDTSNPLLPTVLGSITYTTGSVSKLMVQNGYLYMNANNGFSIFNITNPNSPTLVNSTTIQAGGVYSFSVAGNYLYAVGGGKLWVYNITNKTSPTLVGQLSSLTGIAQDIVVRGNYAYIAAGSGGLIIVDVSNPTSPSIVSTTTGIHSVYTLVLQGNYAYLKNGNDGIAIYAVNIAKPAAPVIAGSIGDSNNGNAPAQTFTTMVAAGNYLYLGGTRFEVVNIANPASMSMVYTGAANGDSLAGVRGRYAIILNQSTSTLKSYDLGGAYTQQLQAGSLQTGSLQADSDLTVGGNQSVAGSLSVSGASLLRGDATINGNLTTQSATNSAAAFQVQNANGNSVLSVDTTGNKVAIGDGVASGDPTLLTLDQAAAAPSTASLGSMYYDTTAGKVRCYQANGWGSCAAAPDTFVTISPEYSGAVMNGTDIGTITSDICSDALNINDGSSGQPTVCGTNETHNFYKWTSTEATTQTRSIFVTYKLPSNFKNFVAGSTSLLGRTDSANSGVTYQVYHDNGSGLTSCGSAISVSSGAQTTWQKATASSGNDPSNCSFAAGDSILFRINLSSMSSANAYVSDLSFVFNNN